MFLQCQQSPGRTLRFFLDGTGNLTKKHPSLITVVEQFTAKNKVSPLKASSIISSRNFTVGVLLGRPTTIGGNIFENV